MPRPCGFLWGAVLAASVFGASGCDTGDDVTIVAHGNVRFETPRSGSSIVGTTVQPVFVWDGDDETVGASLKWDLNRDFSIEDGGGDAFDDALVLRVNDESFSNQSAEEITYLTPQRSTETVMLEWASPITGDYTA